LNQFAHYFKHPELRTRTLNVISLEFSESKLASLVVRPRFVRQIDWIDLFWPKKSYEGYYPKVQLYCLMSVAGCYTDFHIDFGGSSVYYHLISGEKKFYFIAPTPDNLKKYEKWTSSPDQCDVFFADLVNEVFECRLTPGETLIIPTGWIHAVYTPIDSIVIGGNFLHGFSIPLQIKVDEIEIQTRVPEKYRFPYYFKVMWYAAEYYLGRMRGFFFFISIIFFCYFKF